MPLVFYQKYLYGCAFFVSRKRHENPKIQLPFTRHTKIQDYVVDYALYTWRRHEEHMVYQIWLRPKRISMLISTRQFRWRAHHGLKECYANTWQRNLNQLEVLLLYKIRYRISHVIYPLYNYALLYSFSYTLHTLLLSFRPKSLCHFADFHIGEGPHRPHIGDSFILRVLNVTQIYQDLSELLLKHIVPQQDSLWIILKIKIMNRKLSTISLIFTHYKKICYIRTKFFDENVLSKLIDEILTYSCRNRHK